MEQILSMISRFFGIIRQPKQDEPHRTLRFHTTFGTNIYLDENRSTVTRVAGYTNGITFSNRPVQLNEIIPVKITDVRKYQGPLFFGFTAIDPGTLRSGQLGMIRSEEYRIYGVWLKGLHDHEMKPNMILCYKVVESGIVNYSVNGVNYETHLRGVDLHLPLWAIFDVYGSAGGIKLIHLPIESRLESPIPPSPRANPPPRIFVFPPAPSPIMGNRRSPRSANVNSYSFTAGRSSISISPKTPPNSPAEVEFRTPSSPSVSYENKECIICIDNCATTAFLKCGHLCLCYDCALRFIDTGSPGIRRQIYKCPVCRGPVLDIVRIYFP